MFWGKNNILNVSEEFERYFQHLKNSTKKINQQNGHAGKTRIQRFWSKLKSTAKHAVFASNWLFWWKNKILNVSEELEGYFQHLKNSTKKSTDKMATPVRSGCRDFGQNSKFSKTCCFCFKLIVLMKEQNFQCFRRIRRVFSTFEKLNQKNRLTKWITGKVRIQRFWSKLKSQQNILFLLQTDCFDERKTFWMFQKNWKGIFNIWKTQPKKSTYKMAMAVRPGYSDFGQIWKVRKTCCFCFKMIVLMKVQHFECFRRIRRVFSTFQKINQKKSTNKMATPVRSGYSDFGQNSKVQQNMLFLHQTDCFDERTTIWMFQKNWKGIFNISKNQPKKSTNKMATLVRSGCSDFGQNWKFLKTCCFCFKLIVLMKEQHFECFRRIGRVFATFQNSTKKINQKINLQNGHAGKVRMQRFWSKLKITQNMLIVFMKEQHFECFRRIGRVFSTFQKINQKNELKKSTYKMATPVRSGYRDFGQPWKFRKTCCFCFKLIVLMKEQNFECFRRIRKVFSTFQKINQKNGHAGKVRIQRFWSKLKSPQNMLFLLQTDCFDERTKFWMFQKNSKGIFNIWKTQPKKSTNKMATPVRSGYSDFGQNWKFRKTCWLFWWKNNILNVSEELEGYFQHFKKSTKKIN